MLSKKTIDESQNISSFIDLLDGIDSYVKLKSMVYIFSREYPKLFKYDWENGFLGPESQMLSNLLEKSANETLFLYMNYASPAREEYFIDHCYKPSFMMSGWVKSQVEEAINRFKAKGVEDIDGFLTKAVALRNLPTAVSLDESLHLADKRKLLRVHTKDENLSKTSQVTYSEFTTSMMPRDISLLKKYYKNEGIRLITIGKSEKNYMLEKIEFSPNMVDSIVEKKFEDLRTPNNPNEIRFNEPLVKLRELGFSLDDEVLKQTADEYLKKTMERDYRRESGKLFDSTLEGVKEVMKQTSEADYGLYGKFYHSSAVELIAHPDLKKSVEDWDEKYMWDLYHLLQPHERISYMNNLL
jgi:hypothetical protein